jgi:hypothetical protein
MTRGYKSILNCRFCLKNSIQSPILTKMTQQIGELLPALETPGSLVAASNPCEVLTEAEKQTAIDWAIQQEKTAYARSMAEKGELPAKIIAKVAEMDWLAKIDVAEVVRSANQRKQWALDDIAFKKRQKEREQQKNTELAKLWNATRFWAEIKAYFLNECGHFVYDKQTNAAYIQALCYFLAADPRFETELGFSFQKGLLVMGTSGLGKTKTIEAVKNNPLCPIAIYSLIEITERVRLNGFCEINTDRITLLDDMGSETPSVKHYGTDVCWFKDFIESYYLNKRPFNRLIITTNIGGDEIQERYGYRVRSRMREMFNNITIKGDDLRA